MAVTAPGRAPAGPEAGGEGSAASGWRSPGATTLIWLFLRLKLRLIGSRLGRGAGPLWQFIGTVAAGLYLAATGFLLLAASFTFDAPIRLLIASFGGAALVAGSLLLPLIWFGVDDSLDPAKLALLPLPRWRLVAGLLAGSLLGVPALTLLIASAGLLVPAAAHGGLGGLLAQTAGVLLAWLLCVVGSRAMTSAFADMLRSRRVRDLASVLIGGLAALLLPLQFAISTAVREADWDRLAQLARVVGWTPLAAPYTVGEDAAAGRWGAVLAKLVITSGAVLALLWWWSRSLESAMVAADGGGSARRAKPLRGGPVAQLLPRLVQLPAARDGALVARELRYWWRDTKRRVNLITLLVIGPLTTAAVVASGGQLPNLSEEGGGVTFEFGGGESVSPTAVYLTMLLVGGLTASAMANQFGFDGSSYAHHLIVALPGRVELRARALAHAVVVLPLLLLMGVVLGLVLNPMLALAAWGVLVAAYGTGLATNMVLSVLAPYPFPESTNPLATPSGSAFFKSLLALAAIVLTGVVALPVAAVAGLLGSNWAGLALLFGLGYGVVATQLGGWLVGRVVDQRGPELLAAVTEQR